MPDHIEKRTVQPQDLFRLKYLHEAALSPDGRTAVYSVSHVDAEKEKEFSSLWLVDLKRATSRHLTPGIFHDSAPAWSPDGKKIAFLSNRSEKPQIHLISVEGGEGTCLTALKQGVTGGPVWSPDGKWIAFTARPENALDLTKPYRVTRHVYRVDGIGYLDCEVQDIYIIPSEGGEAKKLTADVYSNDFPVWSPDSQEILFLASFNPEKYELYSDVRIVNLKGEMQDLLVNWGGMQAISWTPDGKKIVFSGFPYTKKIGSITNLYIMDAAGGAPEVLYEDFPHWINYGINGDMPVRPRGKILVGRDGRYAFAPVQKGPSIQVYRFALDGKEGWTPLVAAEERCSFLFDGDERRLLLGICDMCTPPELAVVKPDGKSEKQLTRINTEVMSNWILPEIEHLCFTGGYGEMIEGWLMKPPGVEKPYPTILCIHGGPQGAYGHIFAFDFHMLAGAGYAVLFCNPRGSTRYTEEFVMQL